MRHVVFVAAFLALGRAQGDEAAAEEADGNVEDVVPLCDFNQLAMYGVSIDDSIGSCNGAVEGTSQMCDCIEQLQDGNRDDLLELDCKLQQDSPTTVSKFVGACLAGQCMILEGTGNSDGQYEVNEGKVVNGQPTYWRNDGETFWFHCGPKFKAWTVAHKSAYGADPECRGWAMATETPPMGPGPPKRGMLHLATRAQIEVDIGGGGWGPFPDAATVEVRNTICSHHTTPNAGGPTEASETTCMQISDMGGANGYYQSDPTKVLNMRPTMWNADGTKYWFYCGNSTPYWMLTAASTFDDNKVKDGIKIEKIKARQPGNWGAPCRGLFQADKRWREFKAFEEGAWRVMDYVTKTTMAGACTLAVPAPFQPDLLPSIQFLPAKCGLECDQAEVPGEGPLCKIPPNVPPFAVKAPIAAYDTCFQHVDTRHYMFECMADGRLKERVFGDFTDTDCEDQQIIHEEHGGEEHHAIFESGVCGGEAGKLFSLQLTWDPNECPKRDCKVGEWRRWGKCSVTCGEGTMTRTRLVEQERVGNGAHCRSLEETRPCYNLPCPPKDMCEDENMLTRRSGVRKPANVGASKDLKSMFRNEPDAAMCACLRHCQDMEDDSITMWYIKEKSGKCQCMSGYTQLLLNKSNNNNMLTIGGMDTDAVTALLADNGKKKKKNK